MLYRGSVQHACFKIASFSKLRADSKSDFQSQEIPYFQKPWGTVTPDDQAPTWLELKSVAFKLLEYRGGLATQG